MMKKEEKKKINNKYTRREFIKASARVGAGAVAYGTAGYFLGKGYQWLKDEYNTNIKPPIETMENGLKKTKNMFENFSREAKILLHGEKAVIEEENRAWDIERQKINRQREEKQKSNSEVLTRRAFMRYPIKYLEQVNKNPVSTLTITGTAYGAAKSTIRAIPRYLTNSKIARLRDKNVSYEERIGILEEYKEKLEGELGNLKKRGEEYEGQMKDLQGELISLKEILENAGRASGKLETIVKEPTEDHLPLIAIGLTGLLASFILNVSRINGFAIAENASISSFDLSLLLFFLSLGLIFIGTARKKRKIIKKNHYKFR